MKRKRGTPSAGEPGRTLGSAGPAPSETGGRPRATAAFPQWGLFAGLLVTLVALLVHVRAYLFLTDDAFISFRYARNLSHGFGLVFNPGGERVEGYSNFLWVLILAALDRVGLPPERAANVLSIAMTVVLWGLVVWFAWRTHRSPRPSWVILVPACCFAATRSLAVWSSGGLETRMFELFLVGGLLRLILEIEATREGAAPRRPIAPWLFALAALTRPDGLLLAASAFGVTALMLWRDRRGALARFVAGWLPFGVLVGGQFAFRLWYYHEWFPNTYYAKAAGLWWWDSGLRYVSAFALEHAAYLWVPLLVGALLYHRRRRSGYVPLLFAGVILPHLIYIVAIGGDHFEYRPLDLYLPLAFLLLGDGAREWSEHRALVVAVPVYVGLVLAGLFELPYQSHRQFPSEYMSGFPGQVDSPATLQGRYLLPQNDPVYRLPGLRSIAAAYRRRLAKMTADYVGLRQEEHRLFLGTVVAEGRRLRGLIEQGTLPADFYVAMDCVGAIPYYSDIRTLDRLGLTDARVAHSPSVRKFMAHTKSATIEYARERGVDLWIVDPVHSLCPLTSMHLLTAISDAGKGAAAGDTVQKYYAADIGDGLLLLGRLPQGIARTRARIPRLQFRELVDPAFVREFVEKSIPAYLELIEKEPRNLAPVQRLGFICILGQRYRQAHAIYEMLDRAVPDNPGVIQNLALCQEALGDTASARRSVARAMTLALAAGDRRLENRLRAHMRWLEAAPPGP